VARGAGRGPDGPGGGPHPRWTEVLGLPADAVFDLPRLTVVGLGELSVQNHRGLKAFDAERAVVATGAGDVVVEGEDLRVDAVREGEVRVRGRLRAIRFLGTAAAHPPS